MTDGANVAKGVSLQQAIDAAKKAGVAVYAIGIESGDFQRGPLEQVAEATGGSYYGATSSAALAQAYDAVARELARTWRLTYLTAARPGHTLKLTATVAGQGSVSSQTTLPGSTPPPPGEGLARFLPDLLFTSGIAALLLSLAVGTSILMAVGLVMATPASTRLRRRLGPHVGGPRRREKKTSVRERFGGASGLLKATEQAFARFSFWGKLHAMLERADVPLRTAEFFYCMIVPAFLFGMIAAAMALSTLLILVAMVVGGLLPLGFLAFKAKKRVNAIDDQLPDLLITMAASLKAGHSFRQAMQAVVNEGQPPISDEFKRVLTEAQLGRPIDDALAEMADRVQSKNLSFVMTAVTVQRQVGGSLAGIFDMVADAVRQRQAFGRKIKGLTAMGRASAYTLVGMPFALAGIITVINADYMSPLYHTSTGHKMIIVGLVMMAHRRLHASQDRFFQGVTDADSSVRSHVVRRFDLRLRRGGDRNCSSAFERDLARHALRRVCSRRRRAAEVPRARARPRRRPARTHRAEAQPADDGRGGRGEAAERRARTQGEPRPRSSRPRPRWRSAASPSASSAAACSAARWPRFRSRSSARSSASRCPASS